jgi:hypothetical protein
MTIIPPSPFISATAETLPAEAPGKDHCSAGSTEIQSSCGGVEGHAETSQSSDLKRVIMVDQRPKAGSRNVLVGIKPGPQEAICNFSIDEDSFFYAIDPPALPHEHIEAAEIETILRAIQRVA